MPHRKIIHIDMDAFFASVEQRDNPRLRGKPVAVGGSSDRGVVAAASYEARKFGVYSAMPSKIAAMKCPDLIFVKARFDAYKEASEQIRSLFHEYSDLVEPLSLDEAYLDVTHNKKGIKSATLLAQELKQRIFETTQLTASAGISVNKFLAKTASDVNKPNGMFLIPPNEVVSYIARLPIERFYGIGKVTAQKMKKIGIFFGEDLREYSESDLVTRFGKSGHFYYRICRGIDNRPVNPVRIRKSLGAENTFNRDITSNKEMIQAFAELAKEVDKRLKKANKRGHTITLKFKYHDFQLITRSKTISEWIDNFAQMQTLIEEISAEIDPSDRGIRLLGISISNLEHEDDRREHPLQLTLEF